MQQNNMWRRACAPALRRSPWRRSRPLVSGIPIDDGPGRVAQGAATSIEDAAILARCLDAASADGMEAALERYEAHRKPRTSRIQAISSANTWMQKGEQDTSWLYGYDAWNVKF